MAETLSAPKWRTLAFPWVFLGTHKNFDLYTEYASDGIASKLIVYWGTGITKYKIVSLLYDRKAKSYSFTTTNIRADRTAALREALKRVGEREHERIFGGALERLEDD